MTIFTSATRQPYPSNGIAYAQQGDTVDLIAMRFFVRTDMITEQMLDDNRGLAALGVVLPHGTQVALPAPDDLTPTREPETVSLWT